MSRFKILVFLFAVALVGSIVAASYWFSTRVIGKDNKLETQIHQLQDKSKTQPPDPGIRRFEKAVELIKTGNLEDGRRALYELLHSFPDSVCADEARRIIGEINMDMLFSVNTNPTKKNHIVQPGESLGLIARKHQTTIECILRANGMMSSGLQPGDHLFVFPLEFTMVLNLTHKNLTLFKNERLFKVYHLEDIKLPSGVRAPSETTVNDKAAWVSGKRVLSTDSKFNSSDKWLMLQRPGLTLRSKPLPKPPVPQAAPVEADTKKSSKNRAKVASVDPPDDTASETGLFLPREDVEELYTIIRQGTPVKIEK